jgi:catechol 2,3-dioxygenase-like lactoylglutathione lyase family enzyme
MAKRMFLNQLNTRDRNACVEFYKKLGFVEDPGFNQKPGAPVNPLPDFAAKMGVDAVTDAGEFTMLRLPDDDYHLEVGVWKEGKLAQPAAPPKFNQAGVVRISFLVDDIDQELAEVRAKGIPITLGPETLHLQWGTTRFAFIKDPDGTFVEFLEIKRDR